MPSRLLSKRSRWRIAHFGGPGADSSGPLNTTVHIHLSVPSRDWRVRFTIGLSGWPSDMACRPAGPSTARRSVPSAWPGSWAGGIAKLESRGSRGFREILDVNSLRTRVGFGFFVTRLADSKPQTPRRGIGDSRLEPGFWMSLHVPLARNMNTGGFVTSRKWGFIEIKILKNWMKARVPRDDPGMTNPGFF
jgi:hypothetical protein